MTKIEKSSWTFLIPVAFSLFSTLEAAAASPLAPIPPSSIDANAKDPQDPDRFKYSMPSGDINCLRDGAGYVCDPSNPSSKVCYPAKIQSTVGAPDTLLFLNAGHRDTNDLMAHVSGMNAICTSEGDSYHLRGYELLRPQENPNQTLASTVPEPSDLSSRGGIFRKTTKAKFLNPAASGPSEAEISEGK